MARAVTNIDPLLRKLALRDPLGDAERAALSESFGRVRSHPGGATLVKQGSQPTESTLLLSGLAARIVTLQDGTQQITAMHVSGDFVDLHSFLLPRMDHSVVMLSGGQTTSVDHDRLREVCNAHPHLTRLLWLSTLLDSAIHRQWIVTLGRMDAVRRMAHLFCELYLRCDTVGATHDRGFEFPVTQSELADVLGLSAVHVNRTLQELRSRNMITWTGARLRIDNLEGLISMAEFDPTYLQLERTKV